ncbi:rRNA maturation RNAse YbeY [Candidatus Roizmanbacteria bacterium]|nr:rRNA maturation RNAse YbeY [Candidatus Roizmanbacteria bacterium]
MIELFVQSRYHVDRDILRKRAYAFLKKVGIDPDAYVVSIGIIGDRKMSILHKKYAKTDGTTPVLAFPYIQSGYKEKYRPARNATHNVAGGPARSDQENGNANLTLLGEVVISYPQTLIFAADENKMVDDKLSEFVEHGLTNLLQAK